MHRIRHIVIAFALVAGTAHASGDNAGTSAGNFLSVGAGAGILSMAGASLGTGGDLSVAAWNPAALARVDATQFGFAHAPLADQSSLEWLGAGGRLTGNTYWATTALYENDGTFDGTDPTGASTGSFNVTSMALGLRVAQAFTPGLRAGLGAQWIADNLGDVTGHALAFDAGVQASAGSFGFGAAARNVGGSMKYANSSWDLPVVYGLGVAWSHARSGLRLAVDANFPRAYYDDIRAGAEWRWQDRLALRGGYRLEVGAPAGEPLGGPTFGFGTGIDGFWLDYAYLGGNSSAQGQHRMGLSFRPAFLNRALRHVSDASPSRADDAPMAAVAPVAPAPAPVSVPSAPAVAAAPVVAAPPVVDAPPAPPVVAALANVPAEPEASAIAPRPSSPRAIAPLQVSPPVRVVAMATPEPAAETAAVAVVPAPAHVVTHVVTHVAAPVVVTHPVTPALVAHDAKSAPAPAAAAPPAAIRYASSTPRVVVVTHAPAAAAAAARPAWVIVAHNETMADIARRWRTSPAAIMMENDLVDESVHAGQRLKLPAGR